MTTGGCGCACAEAPDAATQTAVDAMVTAHSNNGRRAIQSPPRQVRRHRAGAVGA
jgi:hypothetical protein